MDGMRRAALWVRLICALALIVAAVPLRASAMPCIAPAAAAKQACAMKCCAKPAPAKKACCPTGHLEAAHATLCKAASDCGCEIASIPFATATPVNAFVPSFDASVLVAVLPETPALAVVEVSFAEPGIFGIDSGPPTEGHAECGLGRAPPVVRA